jgi:hypothetical protein
VVWPGDTVLWYSMVVWHCLATVRGNIMVIRYGGSVRWYDLVVRYCGIRFLGTVSVA